MHQLDRIERKLDRLLALLEQQRENIMSSLDDLKAEVAQTTAVEASAVQLIQGLASQITALASQPTVNPADLSALASQLNSSATALAAAIVANTPAAPAPPPAPAAG